MLVLHRICQHMVGSKYAESWKMLTQKTIKLGMLVYGYVKGASDYELHIGLPNNLNGTVSIGNISDGYSEQLKRVMEEDVEGITALHLTNLFCEGAVVVCKVSEICEEDMRILLSLNPRDINHSIIPSVLKNGMVLVGSVKSDEVHGYIIDLGINGIQAFLRTDDASELVDAVNGGNPLKVGQQVRCLVCTGNKDNDGLPEETRITRVVANPSQVKKAKTKMLPFCALQPGTRTKVHVQKKMKKHIVGRCHLLEAVISQDHLKQRLEKYHKTAVFKSTILYIDPSLKMLALSELDHLDSPILQPPPGISVGDIRRGIINKIDETDTVYLKLEDGLTAAATRWLLSDKNIKDVRKVFKIGKKRKCKVEGFNLIENVVIVSLKKSAVNTRFFSLNEASPGMLLNCSVVSSGKNGLLVRVEDTQMKGRIPTSHLCDIDSTYPENFPKGKVLKCRVLKVDKRMLLLTNKPSLVYSKLPPVASVNQLKIGQELEGCISHIKTTSLCIAFYGELTGRISTLNKRDCPILEQFYIGQVVRCLVKKIFKSRPELQLRLIDIVERQQAKPLTEFEIEKTPVKEQKQELPLDIETVKKPVKKQELPADFEIGKLVKCKVEMKTAEGLVVKLISSRKRAFLPRSHLSDSVNCEALWRASSKGTKFEAMYLRREGDDTIVTRKPFLLQAVKEGLIIGDLKDLKVGCLIIGTVRNVSEDSISVEFPGNLVGLAKRKYVSDMEDLILCFKNGQTVLAKVMEIEPETQTFSISLRISDCRHNFSSLQFFKTYFDEKSQIKKLLEETKGSSLVCGMTVGSCHLLKVTAVYAIGILCELKNSVQGYVAKDHMSGMKVRVGDWRRAVVLDVDVESDTVQLSLNKFLVEHIGQVQKDSSLKVKESEKLPALIILIKPDYVLLMLKGCALGHLAYMSTKQHINDAMGKDSYVVGEIITVIVAGCIDKNIIVTPEKNSNEELAQLVTLENSSDVKVGCIDKNIIVKPEKNSNEELVTLENSCDIKVGMVYKARIIKILPLHMKIKFKKVLGRIHITDIVDEIKDGDNPFSKYKPATKILVKVVSIGEAEKQKKNKKQFPVRCSAKLSKINAKVLNDEITFNEGERVLAFVHSCSADSVHMVVTAHIHGHVDFFHLPKTINNVKNIDQHFLPGCGFNATVIGLSDNRLQLSLTDCKENVVVGAITRGMIQEVLPARGLIVKLPKQLQGVVPLTEVSDIFKDKPLAKFEVNQIIDCFVISLNEHLRKQCLLSLRQSRFKRKLKRIKDRPILAISDLSVGDVVRGFVIGCKKAGVKVCLGSGIVGWTDRDKTSKYHLKTLKKVFYHGKVVVARILRVDAAAGRVELSFLEEYTGIAEVIPDNVELEKMPVKSQVKQKETNNLRTREKMKRKTDISDVGPSRKKAKTGVFRSGINKHEEEPGHAETDEDLLNGAKSRAGKNITGVKRGEKVLNTKGGTKGKKDLTDASRPLKRAKSETVVNSHDSGLGTAKNIGSVSKTEATNTMKIQEPLPRLQLTSGFCWNPELCPIEDASSEEELGGNEPKRKKSKDELRREKQEEEKRLFELECQRLKGKLEPTMADDFDCLVLQSPDSSLIWLRYMAFYLETAEIDKARDVAERALKTISFREEQEKFNVWVGYLNMENLYGTKEMLNKVFERALRNNDPLKVLQQMANIYVKSGKIQDAECMHRTMVRRFRQNKAVWINFGLFLFKNQHLDTARNLLEKGLRSINKKQDYIELMSKFAQMEFRFDNVERGKTMFENLLSNYPKRTDLWSVYIDLVVKQKDLEAARQLFERAISLKQSLWKVKFFFKKYLDFESKHGTDETIEVVRQKVAEYMES